MSDILPADIDRIASLPDPVIRNLQITQCYHELSALLAQHIGPCANWCTFATWASKQAGQSIRREDLARAFEAMLGNDPLITQAVTIVAEAATTLGAKHGRSSIEMRVWEILNPEAVIDRTSDAIARGNRKVFEEIGHEFARFLPLCRSDAAADEIAIAEFCQVLRPGEPPDGQEYLRRAFRHYYQALHEGDAQARTELLLLANIEVGFHEQTRLQPEIAEALDAAFADRDEFASRLIPAVFPWGGIFLKARLLFRRIFGGGDPLDTAINSLLDRARQQTRLYITEHLMSLALPRGVRLHLGRDLPPRFPTSLQHVTNAELLALLSRIDPTPDSTRDSGTKDWADLADRIHFIADMFRCYHETGGLFDPPFSPEQVTALKKGRRPGGQL